MKTRHQLSTDHAARYLTAGPGGRVTGLPPVAPRSRDLTRPVIVSVRQNLSPAQDVADGDKQQQLESSSADQTGQETTYRMFMSVKYLIHSHAFDKQ